MIYFLNSSVKTVFKGGDIRNMEAVANIKKKLVLNLLFSKWFIQRQETGNKISAFIAPTKSIDNAGDNLIEHQ